MKILFVYSLDSIQSSSKPLETPERINFGISYIAGLLKQNGHEPYLAVLGSTWQKESLKILKLVCFGSGRKKESHERSFSSLQTGIGLRGLIV